MEIKRETALITGASSGIGYELSKIFAQNGYNLILVARRIEVLRRIKEELSKIYGIEVIIIEKDLSKSYSGNEVFNEIHDLVIQTNIVALTELTYLISNQMIKNEGGKILNVASTGAYQPGPYTAVYYASKAYVLSLTEALSIELKKYNIQVSGLCPGTTKTDFHQRAGKREVRGAMSPKLVAEIGYKEFMKGKSIIIPGIKNKIAIGISRVLPRKVLGKTVGCIQNSVILLNK